MVFIVTQINYKFTPEELKANSRLANCKVCGMSIFNEELASEKRTWWHENAELDLQHEAIRGGV